MRKRILSMGLIILLVLSLLPTPVFALNTNVGGMVTINDDFAAGTLQAVVEATGVGAATNVTELYITSANGELDDTDITYLNTMANLTVLDVASNIVVGDVGNDFFRNQDYLQSITFPALTFGDSAFYDCDALTSVDLPLATTFGDSAFSSCDALESISLPSAIMFGQDVFYSCDKLVSADLPKATTFEAYAFENCIVLESINIPLATNFGDYAFGWCYKLDNISLPSSIEFGNYAFVECHALTNANLPVTISMGDNAFYHCASLTTVNLPSVTSFGNAAFNLIDSTVSMTLGNTIPTAGSSTFSAYNPKSKSALVKVPLAQMTAYDEADGNPGDGMWWGWTLQERVSTYTVSFDSNGGSSVSNQTINEGDKVTQPTDPTKEGYIFNGWYSDEETTNLWNFDTDTVTSDITLYADWIVNNSGGAATTGGTTIQTGSITLTLTDSSGNPLAYYPVELHSTVISSTTDGNGQVTFTDVTLEDHELVIFDKEGIELGTIYLTMSESDTNSTSINGTTVLIYFNESAVSVSIEIAVEGTELVVETATINDNPKTGASDLAVYIGEGSDRVDIIPCICLTFIALLIGCVYVIRNQKVQ